MSNGFDGIGSSEVLILLSWDDDISKTLMTRSCYLDSRVVPSRSIDAIVLLRLWVELNSALKPRT
jgi:hypothetical protein